MELRALVLRPVMTFDFPSLLYPCSVGGFRALGLLPFSTLFAELQLGFLNCFPHCLLQINSKLLFLVSFLYCFSTSCGELHLSGHMLSREMEHYEGPCLCWKICS